MAAVRQVNGLNRKKTLMRAARFSFRIPGQKESKPKKQNHQLEEMAHQALGMLLPVIGIQVGQEVKRKAKTKQQQKQTIDFFVAANRSNHKIP